MREKIGNNYRRIFIEPFLMEEKQNYIWDSYIKQRESVENAEERYDQMEQEDEWDLKL